MFVAKRLWARVAGVTLLGCAFACSSSPQGTQQDPVLSKMAAGAPVAGSGGHAGAVMPVVAGSSAASAAAAAGAAGTLASTAGGACCQAQPAAGCAQHDVEQCVCAQVPSCCQSGWDVVCAQLVETLSCGSCQQSCCEASTTHGCSDASVQACVCKGDPTCCGNTWDAFCVTLVTSLSCGKCP